MKKFNKKGFTLVEMLVVIAIIAVLVSIVIPTVTSSTDKAKAAADAANLRSGMAVYTVGMLDGKFDGTTEPTAEQLGIPATGNNGAFDAEITNGQLKLTYGGLDIDTLASLASGNATLCGAELKDGGKCTSTTKTAAGACTNAASHK